MKVASSVCILVAAAVAVAHTSQKFDLSRRAKVGDNAKYAVSFEMSEQQNVEVSATLAVKVKKVSDNGRADLEMAYSNFKANMDGGSASEMETPTNSAMTVGKNSLPDSMSVQGKDTLATILVISSYLPEKSIAVGEGFKVAWQSKSGSGFMTGEGKFVSVVEKDGKKLAVLKWKASVQPDDVDGPAEISIESRFDLESGLLIDSKGTGSVPNGDIKFSVVPAK